MNICMREKMIKALFLRDGGMLMAVENGFIRRDALSQTKFLALIQPKKRCHQNLYLQKFGDRELILRVGVNEFEAA